MASPSSQSDYHEMTQAERLKKKAADAPFVPLGIAGMLAALGWGAYTYKKRGAMSPSVFLMHLRVKAQGMIVGALALGVGYSLFKDYIFDKEKRDKYVLGKPDNDHKGKPDHSHKGKTENDHKNK